MHPPERVDQRLSSRLHPTAGSPARVRAQPVTSRRMTLDVVAGGDAVAVGQHGQGVGRGHGGELVQPWPPDRARRGSAPSSIGRPPPGRSGSCRRAGGRRSASATARTRGRSRSGWPIIERRAGRAKQLEAHQRRHRVAGQAEHRGAVDHAEGERLGRLMATCIQRMSPMRSSTDLHEVEVAHAHPAADVTRASQAAAPSADGRGEHGLVVGRPAEVDRLEPGSRPPAASSIGRLESRIWPGASGAGAVDQLVAGGQHADPGPGDARRRPRRPTLASTPRWAGREHRARGDDHVARPRRRRRAGARGCPRARPPRTSTPSSPSGASVRSTITTASAPGGIGAPVMMRTASPGPTVAVGRRARRRGCRRPRGGPGASSAAPAVSAARTAKPSIAVLSNGGTASAAATASAVTQPERVGERHAAGAERAARRPRTCGPGLVERDHADGHGRHRPSRSAELARRNGPELGAEVGAAAAPARRWPRR